MMIEKYFEMTKRVAMNSEFNRVMDMGIRNIYYTTDVGYAHEYLT